MKNILVLAAQIHLQSLSNSMRCSCSFLTQIFCSYSDNCRIECSKSSLCCRRTSPRSGDCSTSIPSRLLKKSTHSYTLSKLLTCLQSLFQTFGVVFKTSNKTPTLTNSSNSSDEPLLLFVFALTLNVQLLSKCGLGPALQAFYEKLFVSPEVDQIADVSAELFDPLLNVVEDIPIVESESFLDLLILTFVSFSTSLSMWSSNS